MTPKLDYHCEMFCVEAEVTGNGSTSSWTNPPMSAASDSPNTTTRREDEEGEPPVDEGDGTMQYAKDTDSVMAVQTGMVRSLVRKSPCWPAPPTLTAVRALRFPSISSMESWYDSSSDDEDCDEENNRDGLILGDDMLMASLESIEMDNPEDNDDFYSQLWKTTTSSIGGAAGGDRDAGPDDSVSVGSTDSWTSEGFDEWPGQSSEDDDMDIRPCHRQQPQHDMPVFSASGRDDASRDVPSACAIAAAAAAAAAAADAIETQALMDSNEARRVVRFCEHQTQIRYFEPAPSICHSDLYYSCHQLQRMLDDYNAGILADDDIEVLEAAAAVGQDESVSFL